MQFTSFKMNLTLEAQKFGCVQSLKLMMTSNFISRAKLVSKIDMGNYNWVLGLKILKL